MMPYAAGGPGDTITRIIGAGMTKVLGKQFLVENVGGAGGTIGTQKVAATAPGDGHYLLIMHFGHAANSALYPNLRYDPVTDFEHIGMFAQSPMAIVAKKDFPANDFKEFVAHLKANRAKVVHGHAGLGSASHMCGLAFLQAIDLKVTTVPYKGTAPALNDLIGGQFDFMCDQTVNIAQPVKSGLIKGYAVPTKTRLAVLPELPTTAEMGMPNVTDGRLVWHVGAEGHAEAGGRQAVGGAARCAQGPRGEGPADIHGRRNLKRRPHQLRGVAGAGRQGSRALEGNHHEGRRRHPIDCRPSFDHQPRTETSWPSSPGTTFTSARRTSKKPRKWFEQMLGAQVLRSSSRARRA